MVGFKTMPWRHIVIGGRAHTLPPHKKIRKK